MNDARQTSLECDSCPSQDGWPAITIARACDVLRVAARAPWSVRLSSPVLDHIRNAPSRSLDAADPAQGSRIERAGPSGTAIGRAAIRAADWTNLAQ